MTTNFVELVRFDSNITHRINIDSIAVYYPWTPDITIIRLKGEQVLERYLINTDALDDIINEICYYNL